MSPLVCTCMWLGGIYCISLHNHNQVVGYVVCQISKHGLIYKINAIMLEHLLLRHKVCFGGARLSRPTLVQAPSPIPLIIFLLIQPFLHSPCTC